MKSITHKVLIISLLTATLLSLPQPTAAVTRIVISGTLSDGDYESLLIIPGERGGSEKLSGLIEGKTDDNYVSASGRITTDPAIRREIFTIKKLIPGHYQLWVVSASNSVNPGTPFRDIQILVEIFNDSQKIASIQMPDNPSGNIWLPLDMDGTTGEVINTNQFYSEQNSISGFVTDAVSGKPINNALVLVKNRDTRETVGKTVTDNSGKFKLSARIGRYDIWLGKRDYISDKFSIDVRYDLPAELHTYLSPVVPDGELRMVLVWDRFPKNIDAYLTGPDPDGKEFHITGSKNQLIGGKQFIDIDDTESFGPETITIRNITPGVYTYSVFYPQNDGNNSSTTLASGNVQVRLYSGDRMIKIFNLPPGTSGNFWKVFQYDGNTGEIIDINQTEFKNSAGQF